MNDSVKLSQLGIHACRLLIHMTSLHLSERWEIQDNLFNNRYSKNLHHWQWATNIESIHVALMTDTYCTPNKTNMYMPFKENCILTDITGFDFRQLLCSVERIWEILLRNSARCPNLKNEKWCKVTRTNGQIKFSQGLWALERGTA